MAKGDSGEMQNLINQQQNIAQSGLNTANARTAGQYDTMYGNYNTGVNRNMNDYGGIMGGYNTFLSGGNPGMTGGYSPQYGSSPSTNIQTTQPLGRALLPSTSNSPGNPDISSLSDPNAWMSMVNNDQQRTAFARSVLGPNASDDLVNYYSSKIKEQPGANPTEQAGSAQYWTNKMKQDPMFTGATGTNSGSPTAIGAWQQAIDTGMITPQQVQDLRARAVAPVRAAYQQASDNVERQRALNGGYSPGYDATQAKLAREQAYGMSDAETNANASIVSAIQQGKLAGAQGLTGAQLGALAGQTGLYGATPGLTSTFGNQVLGTNQQALQGQSLQQQLAQILFNAKLGQSQIPGDYQQALGNIGGTIGLAGDAAGAVSGLGGIFNKAPLPSTYTVPGYNYGGLMPGLTGGYGLS